MFGEHVLVKGMIHSKSEKKEDEDAPLVSRAKKGDFEAFETLVSRHEKRLYALVMNILRNRADAEDVVQSTFISVLEHLDQFREKSLFLTWITRIASNTSLKILRKRGTQKSISLDDATTENEEGIISHPDFIADWRGNPSMLLEQHELQTILDKAIDALAEKHRLVFMLRDVVGMSIDETAKALGISTANVKVRLLRARLALREILTRQFGDEGKRFFHQHDHDGDQSNITSAQLLLQSYQSG